MQPPLIAPRRAVAADIRRLQFHLLNIAAGVLLVLAAGLLLGWSEVTRGRPEWPEVYPYTVAGAAALVVAMALMRHGGRAATVVATLLAGAVVVLGMGTDLAVSVGLLPSSDPVTGTTSWTTVLPSAAATATAASVLLIPQRRPWLARLRFWLAAAAGVVMLLIVLSYVYGSDNLIGGLGYTGTSLPAAAVGLLMVSASMAARPDQPPLAALDQRYDRALVRRILPALAVAPFLPAIVHSIVAVIVPDPATADAVAQLVTVVILIAVIVLLGGAQSRARRELTGQRQQVWDAFEHAPAATAVVGVDGEIVSSNGALGRLTGRPASELIGVQVSELVDEAHRDRLSQSLADVVATGVGFRHDVQFRRHAGGSTWVDLNVAPVRRADGSVAYLIAQCTDLTDRKELERVLAEQAIRDPLTGLLNRDGLGRSIDELRRLTPPDRDVVVAYADVDGLKELNDWAGHAAGDALLVEVGQRLRACTRSEDVVARVGGDEFVVVTAVPTGTPASATAVVDRLREALSGPVDVGSAVVDLSVSLGATTLAEYADAADAMSRADQAMYDDKRSRRQGDRPAGGQPS